MPDNISPEEKLLKLIRGQKKEGTINETPLQAKPALKFTESEKIQTPLPKSTPRQNRAVDKYRFSLKTEHIFGFAFFLACVYLILSLLYPLFGLKKGEVPHITIPKITEQPQEKSPEPQPVDFYLQGIKSKQVFASPVAQEAGNVGGGVDIDLTKDINLVGVISGDNPQAVVEDKKAQKVYYLSKGQYLGQFQIADIQESKIVVTYKGQNYELFL